MSQSSFTPIVVLFEDRPKQNTVFELNLSIYLDAKVINASSMNDLKKIFSSSEKAHLIVARSEFKGSPFLPKLMEELAGINAAVPVIGLGLSQDVPGVISVSDLEVKPMLQSAARILKITAKDMAFKKQPEVFLIRPEFLNLLFNFPCDVFDPDRGLERKIFSIGDSVNRGKIKTFVKQ